MLAQNPPMILKALSLCDPAIPKCAKFSLEVRALAIVLIYMNNKTGLAPLLPSVRVLTTTYAQILCYPSVAPCIAGSRSPPVRGRGLKPETIIQSEIV